ncbi:MAG: CPBP family intramembrane glutamic endopeptidase [Chitinophagales bacterium]
MRRKAWIYGAGIFTLFGLGGFGMVLIHKYQSLTFLQFIHSGTHSFPLQFLLGTVYGIIISGILLLLLQRQIMHATKDFFSMLLRQLNIQNTDILFLSVCAGVGEEILFRGALQYWLGIWLTAFVFIALHGYLNPKNKPLAIYGLLLLIVTAGFGYLYQHSGIWSAAAAHGVIDIALMYYLRKQTLSLWA